MAFFSTACAPGKKTSGGTARHLHLSGDTEKSSSPSADDRHQFFSSLSCFAHVLKFLPPVSDTFCDASGGDTDLPPFDSSVQPLSHWPREHSPRDLRENNFRRKSPHKWCKVLASLVRKTPQASLALRFASLSPTSKLSRVFPRIFLIIPSSYL
ncbi:UNVERIFIED_CONTAM: hypothetical protein HHA_452100 [Hammondia hammondi]|eukprot:XP_008885140.1 hypothetical protein HHA_452100 [Hammondia hammondi]